MEGKLLRTAEYKHFQKISRRDSSLLAFNTKITKSRGMFEVYLLEGLFSGYESGTLLDELRHTSSCV